MFRQSLSKAQIESNNKPFNKDEDSSETDTSTMETTTSEYEQQHEVRQPFIEEKKEEKKEESKIDEKVKKDEEIKEISGKKVSKSKVKKTKETVEVTGPKQPIRKEGETTNRTIITGSGKIITGQLISKSNSDPSSIDFNQTTVGNEFPFEYEIVRQNEFIYVIVGEKKALLKIEITNQEKPFGDSAPTCQFRNVDFLNNADYDNYDTFQLSSLFMENKIFSEEEISKVKYVKLAKEGDTDTIEINGKQYKDISEDINAEKNVIQFSDGAILKNSNLKDTNNVHVISNGIFSDGNSNVINSNEGSNQAVEFGTNKQGISYVPTLKIKNYDVSGGENIETRIKNEVEYGAKYAGTLYSSEDYKQYIVELVSKYHEYQIMYKKDDSSEEVDLLTGVVNGSIEGPVQGSQIRVYKNGGSSKSIPEYSHITEDSEIKLAIVSRITNVNGEVNEETGEKPYDLNMQEAIAHTMVETPLQIKTITYDDGKVNEPQPKKGRVVRKPRTVEQKDKDVIEIVNMKTGEEEPELTPDKIRGVEVYELEHKEMKEMTTEEVLEALQSTEKYIRSSFIPSNEEDVEGKHEFEYGKQDTFFRARFYQELFATGLPLYLTDKNVELPKLQIRPVKKQVKQQKKNTKGTRKGRSIKDGDGTTDETVDECKWTFGPVLSETKTDNSVLFKENEVYLKSAEELTVTDENVNTKYFTSVFRAEDLVSEDGIDVKQLKLLLEHLWDSSNQLNSVAASRIVESLRDYWTYDVSYSTGSGEDKVTTTEYLLEMVYKYFVSEELFTLVETEPVKSHIYGELGKDSSVYSELVNKCTTIPTILSTWIDIIVSMNSIPSKIKISGVSEPVTFIEYLNAYLGQEIESVEFTTVDPSEESAEKIKNSINEGLNNCTTWGEVNDFITTLGFNETDKWLLCPTFHFYDEEDDKLIQIPMALYLNDFKQWFRETYIQSEDGQVPEDKRSQSVEIGLVEGRPLPKDIISEVKSVEIHGTTSEALGKSLSGLTCSRYSIDNSMSFSGFMVPLDKEAYFTMIMKLIKEKLQSDTTFNITFKFDRFDSENGSVTSVTLETTSSEIKECKTLLEAFNTKYESEDEQLHSSGMIGYYPCIMTSIELELSGIKVEVLHEDMGAYATTDEMIEDVMAVKDKEEVDRMQWLSECEMKASLSGYTLLYTIVSKEENEWYGYAPLYEYYVETPLEGKDHWYLILEAITNDTFGVTYKYICEFREFIDYGNLLQQEIIKKYNVSRTVHPQIKKREEVTKPKKAVKKSKEERILNKTNVNGKENKGTNRYFKTINKEKVTFKRENKNEFCIRCPQNVNCNNELISSVIKKILEKRKSKSTKTVNDKRNTNKKNGTKRRVGKEYDDETKRLFKLILGFRHYCWELMIEYLQHVQSLSRTIEYFIEMSTKYDIEEDSVPMTTGKLLEFLLGTEKVPIDSNENGNKVNRYEWLCGRKVEDIDFIYDSPIVSGYNPIPTLDSTNYLIVDMMTSYEVYRSDVFESTLYEPDVIRSVFMQMSSEIPDDFVLFTNEDYYEYNNVSKKDELVYEKGIIIDSTVPFLTKPVQISVLYPDSSESSKFSDKVSSIFSIYDKVNYLNEEVTESSTRIYPLPCTQTGVNYINCWIYKQLTQNGIEVPDWVSDPEHPDDPTKRKRIEWYVTYSESSALETKKNVNGKNKRDAVDETHKLTYADFLSKIRNIPYTYQYTLSNSVIKVEGDSQVDDDDTTPNEIVYFKTEQEAVNGLVSIIIASKDYVNYSQEMKEALHGWQQSCSKLPNGSSYDVGKTFKIDTNPVGGEFDPSKVYTLDKLLSTTKLPDELKVFNEEGLKGIITMIPYAIYCEELYPSGGDGNEDGIKEEDVEVKVDDFYTNWDNAKRDLLTFINLLIQQQGKKRGAKPMTKDDIQGSLHRWQYLCSHLGPDGNAQMNLDDVENVITPSSTGVTFKIIIKDSGDKRHELYLDELLSGNGITLLKSSKEVVSVEMHPYLIDRSGEIDDDENTEDDDDGDDEDNLDGVIVVKQDELDRWLSECEIITYEDKKIKKYNLKVAQSMEEIFKYYNKMAKELYSEKWKFKDNDPADSPKGELIPKFNWNVIEMNKNDYSKREMKDFWEEMEAQRNIWQKDSEIKMLWCCTYDEGTYVSEFKPESDTNENDEMIDNSAVDTFMVQQFYNRESTETEKGQEVITVFRYKDTFKNSDDFEKLILNGRFIKEEVPSSKETFEPFTINEQPFSDEHVGSKVGVIESDSKNKVNEGTLQFAYLILERDSDVDGQKVPNVVRVPKNKK